MIIEADRMSLEGTGGFAVHERGSSSTRRPGAIRPRADREESELVLTTASCRRTAVNFRLREPGEEQAAAVMFVSF